MDEHLERLRRMCLSMPQPTEQVAWGEPTFRVRNRIFAMYAAPPNHHGRGREALWCSAPIGVQEELVRSEPDRYFVPPYVGLKGGIGIYLDTQDDAELRSHVLQSFCRIAPRKLQDLVAECPIPATPRRGAPSPGE